MSAHFKCGWEILLESEGRILAWEKVRLRKMVEEGVRCSNMSIDKCQE